MIIGKTKSINFHCIYGTYSAIYWR